MSGAYSHRRRTSHVCVNALGKSVATKQAEKSPYMFHIWFTHPLNMLLYIYSRILQEMSVWTRINRAFVLRIKGWIGYYDVKDTSHTCASTSGT